jgi:hypothetical protein
VINDANGIPLKVITTGGNVPDVTQALALVDGVPPGGRPGGPTPPPPPGLCSTKRATTATPTAVN